MKLGLVYTSNPSTLKGIDRRVVGTGLRMKGVRGDESYEELGNQTPETSLRVQI